MLTGSGFKDFARVLEMIRIPDRVRSGFVERLEAAIAVA
jgi:hypothetical protein